MTDRAGRATLLIALIGHAALLLLLSLAWGPQAKREWPKPEPMEVSLVAEVAPEATAPPAPVPPASSVAPEEGAPEEAPPPSPVPQPQAARPAPTQPAAKPAAQPRPAPAAARPQPTAPAKPAAPAAARSSRLAGLQLGAGTKADAAPARPRGRRLGDNFLAGLAPDAPATKASTAAPGKAGPYPAASIAGAIARQIQPCADRQVNPGPGANAIVTTLNLRLNPDGTLAATPRMVRQSGVTQENERYAQRVVDLGVAAFKGCTPLKLPAEYYDTGNGGWSNINYRWQLR